MYVYIYISKYVEGNSKHVLKMKSFLVIQTYSFVRLIFFKLSNYSRIVFCSDCFSLSADENRDVSFVISLGPRLCV